MPFDLKTAVLVKEKKDKSLDTAGSFDISTAKAVSAKPEKQSKQHSFIQGFGESIGAKAYESIGAFNELLGLGAFTKTKELFITSAYEGAKELRGKYTPKNKVEEYGLKTAEAVGMLAVDIPIDVMIGVAAKAALVGKMLPKVIPYFSALPDFALGMGIRGTIEGVKEEGTIAEKTVKGTIKGAEDLAFGTIYGSIAKLKVPIMASIGAGEVAYQAFKEGYTPTKEDLADGAIMGATMGMFFSLIPFLQKRTRIAKEGIILGKAKKEVVGYQNKKNLSGIKSVFKKLSTNKELRPELRDTFRVATEEVSRMEEGIRQNMAKRGKLPAAGVQKPAAVPPVKAAGKSLVAQAKKFKAPGELKNLYPGKVFLSREEGALELALESKTGKDQSPKATKELANKIQIALQKEGIKSKVVGSLEKKDIGNDIDISLDDVGSIPKAIEFVKGLGFELEGISVNEENGNIFIRTIDDVGRPLELFVQQDVAKPKKVITNKLLVNKIKDIRQQYKTPVGQARQEIKAVQAEFVDYIKKSGLDAKDKSKFISTIKNMQTPEQLDRGFKGIETRIKNLVEASEKRDLSAEINKELKAVKPVKQGQKKVAKYDYETNKALEELRGKSKLTQAKAQKELDDLGDVASRYDLIKKRLLSLKANGASSSVELHKQVAKDIKYLKEQGKLSKNEQDFEQRIAREDNAILALDSMNKIKGDKNTFVTKTGNAYRRGFSNIYSMMNSMFGKSFAEKYNPEIYESKRGTATYYKTKEQSNAISEIYDEKKVLKLFGTMGKKEYQMTDFEGLTTDISKMQLVDIYNSLKNDLLKERYYNAFGQEHVDQLLANLTYEDKQLGDYLQENIKEYWSVLNEREIEVTGRDLGRPPNYWPATSEFQPDVYDDLRLQGETPSAMKARSKSSKIIPVPRDALSKAQRHIAQGEHVRHLSRRYETLKRMFTDRKLKHEIIRKYGDDVYRTLLDQVENISLNKQLEKVDAVSGLFQKAVNNWVTAKVAFNPTTLVRQLMSQGNYMEDMKVVDWVKGYQKGLSHPIKTFDYMWKNAKFLEARFNRGYSEAMQNAISDAGKLSANWGNYTKFMGLFARSGDITAIVYGGYPLVQSEIAKGKTVAEAFEVFEKATLKAQQSGLSSSLSQFQNSRNAFTRLFLAFKNTTNQYLRKRVDTIIQYINKDISKSDFGKRMAIYSVIQPVLYALAGVAIYRGVEKLGDELYLRMFDKRRRKKKDKEEFSEAAIKDVVTQLLVAPINAVPIIDDIVEFGVRKALGRKAWKPISVSLIDDLNTTFSKMSKKDIGIKDVLEVTGGLLEPTLALPTGTALRYYDLFLGE